MREHLKPYQFKPGDPRINRAGRPKSFDALRELALMIAHEDTGDGVLRVERILRTFANGDARQQAAFLEICYGRPPANAPEEVERGPVRLTIDMRSPEAREADGDGP